MSDQKKCCCTKDRKSEIRCNKNAYTRYKHFCLNHQANCGKLSDDKECQYLTEFIPRFHHLYLPTSPYKQSGTVLGTGAYGQVRELEIPHNNRVVKTIKRDPSRIDYITSDVLAELSACQLTSGLLNISGCLNFGFYDPNNVVKIYYDKYDINGYAYFNDLYHNDPYNFDKKHHLMYQMAIGMMELHSRYIAHLDFKPSNFLIKKGPVDQLVITDFGLASEIYPPFKYAKSRQSKHVQTIDYRAPEVAIGLPYDQKADIWSMGLIFFEMLCNTTKRLLSSNTIPYRSSNNNEIDFYFLSHIFSIFGKPLDWDEANMAPNDNPYHWEPLHIKKFPDSALLPLSMRDLVGNRMTISRHNYVNMSDQLYDQIIDLLSKMLVVDPRKRFDIQDVLIHPFFSKYNSLPDCPIARLTKTTSISRVIERDILPSSSDRNNWIHMNPEIDVDEFGGQISDFVQTVIHYFGRNISINFLFYTSKLYEIVLSLMDLSQDQSKQRLALYACFHIYLKIDRCVSYNKDDLLKGFRTGPSVIQFFTMDELIEMEKSIVILLEGNLWIPTELSYLKVLMNTLDQTKVTSVIKLLAFMKLTMNNSIFDDLVVMDELTKVKSCLDYYKVIIDDTLSEEVRNFAKHCGEIIDKPSVVPTSFEGNVKYIVDRLYLL